MIAPNISIIIATYNRPSYLCAAIRQALSQRGVEAEVIVVDQTDGYPLRIQEELNALRPSIQYLHLPQPNPSSARNLGLRAARGEVVLFVDDDVLFGKDLARNHFKTYEDGRIGGVLGLIIPERWENRNRHIGECRKLYYATVSPTTGTAVDILWAPTGNTSYRRKLLQQIGGFDEKLFIYCEDADLSVRVRKAGYRLVLNPEAELVHLAALTGGCAERDSEHKSQRETQRLWCSLYYHQKHAKYFGARAYCTALWKMFRGYALNRQSVPCHLLRFYRRSQIFAAAWADAKRVASMARYSQRCPQGDGGTAG